MAKKQGRFFRPKPASLKGTPYDSTTEQRLHQGVLANTPFHSEKVPYSVEHKYNPDFIIDKGDTKFLVEVKGYFQDRAEMSKYKWIKKALPEGTYLVFVLEKPDKPIHFQSKRGDGTKMTHEEWCQKEGFMVFTEETIGDLL